MLLNDVVTVIHTSYVIFITTQMIVSLLFYIVIKHGLLKNVKCTNITAQMIVLLLLYIVFLNNKACTILYLRFDKSITWSCSFWCRMLGYLWFVTLWSGGIPISTVFPLILPPPCTVLAVCCCAKMTYPSIHSMSIYLTVIIQDYVTDGV